MLVIPALAALESASSSAAELKVKFVLVLINFSNYGVGYRKLTPEAVTSTDAMIGQIAKTFHSRTTNMNFVLEILTNRALAIS